MEKRGVQTGAFLLEALLGANILVMAICVLAGTVGSGMSLHNVNRENSLGIDAARQQMDRLQSACKTDFRSVFAEFNADPADDPQGPGSAVGSSFAFRAGWSLNVDCEVRFPTGGTLDAELREDVAGRDLNGDGTIDSLDHSGDYLILPVALTVRWTGSSGTRSAEYQALLSRR